MMNETATEKNVDIESVDPYEEALGDWVDRSFDAFAEQNGVQCNYTPFAFTAKKDGRGSARCFWLWWKSISGVKTLIIST